jgi:hypothetical protein
MGIFWFEMASTVIVEATPEGTFEVVERARDWPRWSRVVVAVDEAPESPWKPGSTLSFRLRMAARTVGFRVSVNAYEPAVRLAWSSKKFTITAVRSILFEPVTTPSGHGTRVTDHKRFSSPVFPIGVAYPRPLIRRMTESWLGDLKVEAERH